MFDRMLDCFAAGQALPVHCAAPAAVLAAAHAADLAACGFDGQPGRVVLLPGAAGLDGAVLGLGVAAGHSPFGALAAALPAGLWRLEGCDSLAAEAVLGFALGAYRFDTLKTGAGKPAARLVLPEGDGVADALRAARATWLVRDLINTPPNHLGPAELARAANDALHARGAHVNVIEGDALSARFPAVQAVGEGSARPPAVVHATWRSPRADADAPLLCVCGKGVCFDTGGYDIKPAAGMLRMKKDMAGAAIALGLACMIIEADLPIRLELRLGCAENMISGSALRPSDVIATLSGLSVEVGNTDAEGRLVLAESCRSAPDLLLDFATLTGAARTALGPDLPAMFANDDALASVFAESGRDSHDPVWRLPLWGGYNSWLESTTADLNNVSEKAYAGAIVAALFLQRFVSVGTRWAHFDVYAWNDADRHGRPQGGEAQAMRAAFLGVVAFLSGFDAARLTGVNVDVSVTKPN